MNDRIDVAIARTEISRRHFLAGSAMAGFAAFLAACGTSGQGTAAPTSAATQPPAGTGVPGTAAPTEVAMPTGGGTLNFANWIGYIDITDDGSSYPTLEKFTAESGVEVNYKEDVDGNESFFTSDLQAPLSAGQPTAWDIVVVTDWMVARLARLGWLETINTGATPNFPANLAEQYHGRSFDPDTNLAAPWQSGMTGIGFDKAITGDLTSVNVFWDEKWKGRMTYLDEMRDTVGLAAIKLGLKPEELTEDQFQQALAEIDTAVKAGLPRQLAGNYYVDVMAAGDAVVGMAWSGDVTSLLQPDQSEKQDFQWALPTEGGMLWTDNMVIPKGAKNKGQAELWINFYYEPTNAATIEAWVNYVCPVKGAREAMLEMDPDLASNPLIFPTDDMTARLHQFRATTADEEQRWAEDFSKVAGL
ncbi:MAG TPA: extracellular solute-binding protein [Candidatus Limnocylindrales bacterium]|nr:extracellular solute-binding protein [Candidatus Limnocylindrales bacterium]